MFVRMESYMRSVLICCDDFITKDFHCRRDDRTNTLILILDIEENVFGSFMLIEWKLRVAKCDINRLIRCGKFCSIRRDSKVLYVCTISGCDASKQLIHNSHDLWH